MGFGDFAAMELAWLHVVVVAEIGDVNLAIDFGRVHGSTAFEKQNAQRDQAMQKALADEYQSIDKRLGSAALAAADIPVHVHTGIRTTHAKTLYVGADMFTAPKL